MAVADSTGRVAIYGSQTLKLLHQWKGYHSAQLCYLSPDEITLYTSKKGSGTLLEVWNVWTRARTASISLSDSKMKNSTSTMGAGILLSCSDVQVVVTSDERNEVLFIRPVATERAHVSLIKSVDANRYDAYDTCQSEEDNEQMSEHVLRNLAGREVDEKMWY